MKIQRPIHDWRNPHGLGEGVVNQFPTQLNVNNGIDRVRDLHLGRGIRAKGDNPVVNQAWLSDRLRGRLNVINTR